MIQQRSNEERCFHRCNTGREGFNEQERITKRKHPTRIKEAIEWSIYGGYCDNVCLIFPVSILTRAVSVNALIYAINLAALTHKNILTQFFYFLFYFIFLNRGSTL